MSIYNKLKELSLDSIEQYTKYTDSIKPKTEDDILRRWLFAFCSIHTTWESTIRGYLALQDLQDLDDQNAIRLKLKQARIGLHNNRSAAIYKFVDAFRKDPSRYSFTVKVREVRFQLANELYGIGLAKTSFAAEMIEPRAKTICLDVHTLRWFGETQQNITSMKYRLLENKWIRACNRLELDPVAARHAVWDKTQGKQDMRYWTWVFE